MRARSFAFVALPVVLAFMWHVTSAQNVKHSASHRLVEVTGIRIDRSLATRFDIFLEVAQDQDEATLAKDALARAGALPPSLSSNFKLTGSKWPQFFDQNQTNDVVWESYNPNGQNVVGDAIVALQSAEQEWTNVSTTSFQLAYNGPSTLGAAYDGVNVISWPSVWNQVSSAFAITLTAYDINTGFILDADIVLNRNFQFFSQPGDVGPNRVDLRYVVLHENGHLAGLDHSPDPSAVMYNGFTGGIVGHGLATDDINAISTLYPANSTFTPVILMEQSTSNAVALDSVTFERGPFSIPTPNNFSADRHRRIILFTSNLKLAQQQNPDPSIVSVQASGVDLTVENVGPLTGVAGLNASFIVVRLPDALLSGDNQLTVTLRGTPSSPTTLVIQ
jgi:hypothetical protein